MFSPGKQACLLPEVLGQSWRGCGDRVGTVPPTALPTRPRQAGVTRPLLSIPPPPLPMILGRTRPAAREQITSHFSIILSVSPSTGFFPNACSGIKTSVSLSPPSCSARPVPSAGTPPTSSGLEALDLFRICNRVCKQVSPSPQDGSEPSFLLHAHPPPPPGAGSAAPDVAPDEVGGERLPALPGLAARRQGRACKSILGQGLGLWGGPVPGSSSGVLQQPRGWGDYGKT